MILLHSVPFVEDKPRAREFLTKFKPMANAAKKEWKMMSGLLHYKNLQNTGPSLAKYVRDYDCDLIAVACRDAQLWGRCVHGSLSEEMVRRAACHVLVWKDPLSRTLHKMDPSMPAQF